MSKIIDLRTTSISSMFGSLIEQTTNNLKTDIEQQLNAVYESIPTTAEQINAAEKQHEHSQYLTQHQSLIDYAKLSDIPQTLPASDVYSWAKQVQKPTYTYSEVGAAPAEHSHNQYTINSEIQAKPFYTITQEDINKWNNPTQEYDDSELRELINNKQNIILDLNDIREGAALGKTALQAIPESYATKSYISSMYQVKGNYLTEHQDISGKQDVIADLDTIRTKANSALQTLPENLVYLTDLATKANISHTHQISDITNFPSNISYFTNDSGFITSDYLADYISYDVFNQSLEEKADIEHTHSISDITDFNDSNYASKEEIEEVSDEVERALNIIINSDNYFDDIINDVEEIVG